MLRDSCPVSFQYSQNRNADCYPFNFGRAYDILSQEKFLRCLMVRGVQEYFTVADIALVLYTPGERQYVS